MITIATPRPLKATHCAGSILLELADSRSLSFPVRGNARLERGTPEQLGNIRLSPYGLHWPDLDEDLSIEGILNGDWGQFVGKPRP